MSSAHGLSKSEIVHLMLKRRAEGALYDLPASAQDEDFFSSLDRFSEIAARLRDCRRILDVGSGSGVLISILAALGHEVYAIDFFDKGSTSIYRKAKATFAVCNIEADELPFPDDFFDAVCCCQTLEHFTHAHLPAVLEMKRVLRPGGMLEIDVPNAACFRNRWRMVRGKHVTWDYKDHYLTVQPSVYKGREYYPNRHNREFVIADLKVLYEHAGFCNVSLRYLRDERIRPGYGKLRSAGSWLRNAVPGLRKSLIGFGEKPMPPGSR